MGRFASTVEFYARYREPYPPKLFKKVAEQIDFRGNESSLDVGCGPGLLAIGFAPFVGRCTGLDPETGMISAAKAAAAEAGVELSLVHGPNRRTHCDSSLRCHHHWSRTSLVGT
jgi:SAM-dependent methyltransferase